MKRFLDVLGSVSSLVLLSPLIAVVALLIKLTSKGPILYCQERIGFMGRPFTILKFRTMKTNSDPAIHRKYVQSLICGKATVNGGLYKLASDHRITKVGSFLRKTSLDELPQLINVLKGDMSLVGPRPPIPYEVEFYEPWHHGRLFVKPGITGLWQVRGRNKTTFREMVLLDLHYIASFSLWMDLQILMKTPLALISGR
jgi:lipopolysaccharide/colanic/teichoic acid biosynthesis glycosyltransferase